MNVPQVPSAFTREAVSYGPRLPGGTEEPGIGTGVVVRWGPLPSTPISDWVTLEPCRSLLHKSKSPTENFATWIMAAATAMIQVEQLLDNAV